MTRSRIAVRALLLAAGQGTRFGGDKLPARLPDGTPIGVAALRNLQQAIGPAIAVVRPHDAPLAEVFRNEGATVVIAKRADEGMGASFAAGVARIPENHAIVVALADMPWIAPATIVLVAEALRAGARIAAPCYQGKRGHPVGFAPSLREALLALTGDEGARGVLARHADEIVRIDVNDDGVLRDVDRPDDIAG